MIHLKEKDLPEVFKREINLIRSCGFKPIAVSSLICESTFCFETEQEAIEAHKKLERDPQPSVVQGWWYGRKEFLEVLEDDEKRYPDSEPVIYWLDN